MRDLVLRLSTCMAKPQYLFDFAILAVVIPSVLRGRVLDPRTRSRHAPDTAHQDTADVHDHRNMQLDSTGIPDQLRLGRFVEASWTVCANARDRDLDYGRKGPCCPLRVTHGIATPADEPSRNNSRICSHTSNAERRHHAHIRHRPAHALLLRPSPDSRRQLKPITRSQADCYPPRASSSPKDLG